MTKPMNIRTRIAFGFLLLGTILLCIAGLNIVRAHDVAPLTVQQLEVLDLSQTDKLMIVAHPDDEVIWGGGHLLDRGYLVVCITNGRNQTRKAEFEQAVTKSGNIPLILEYPDKVNFLRDNWDQVRSGIESDLQTIISYKSWSLVVTHNSAGEYGHQHHIMTNQLTSEAFSASDCTADFYVFGTYYKAKDLPANKTMLNALDDDTLKAKEDLCAIYDSQSRVMDHLEHMFPYENWTPVEPTALKQ